MIKPPYRVPTMQEINNIPWNGLTAISTFSGCGGSSLGYRMAGYRVLYANEFIPAARDTYRANCSPGTIVDDRDIREVTAEDILTTTGTQVGDIDLVDGSPPCASFSASGKRSAGWGQEKEYSDTHQRVDDLFWEYARLIRGIQPRVFVAENVAGLVRGVAKGYFLRILAELRSCGYRVEARLLDAQWLGVPQIRKRLIFIGIREDLQKDPVFPAPLGYRYSIGEAIPETIDPGRVTITDMAGGGPESDTVARTLCPSIRAEWHNIAGGSSNRYQNLMRGHSRKPSYTITAGGGKDKAAATHPNEPRKFTINELRRICAFPDDFILTGTYEQRWERLGRAVPPVMMAHIATTIRNKILT